jgi:DNA-binding transcriptional LysR family regulator
LTGCEGQHEKAKRGADSAIIHCPRGGQAFDPYRLLLCARPGYLAGHGTPQVARDLERHATVRFRYPNSGKLQEWPLKLLSDDIDLRLDTALTCNNMEAVRGATLRGLGIGCMPDFLVFEALASGHPRDMYPQLLYSKGSKWHWQRRNA